MWKWEFFSSSKLSTRSCQNQYLQEHGCWRVGVQRLLHCCLQSCNPELGDHLLFLHCWDWGTRSLQTGSQWEGWGGNLCRSFSGLLRSPWIIITSLKFLWRLMAMLGIILYWSTRKRSRTRYFPTLIVTDSRCTTQDQGYWKYLLFNLTSHQKFVESKKLLLIFYQLSKLRASSWVMTWWWLVKCFPNVF